VLSWNTGRHMTQRTKASKVPKKQALKTLMCTEEQHREMVVVAAHRAIKLKTLTHHMWEVYKAHMGKRLYKPSPADTGTGQ
jgi:prolyl-tRNA editing enzyme YbaK/EbsC (Cys-tRNA(Pro) deacylase)